MRKSILIYIITAIVIISANTVSFGETKNDGASEAYKIGTKLQLELFGKDTKSNLISIHSFEDKFYLIYLVYKKPNSTHFLIITNSSGQVLLSRDLETYGLIGKPSIAGLRLHFAKLVETPYDILLIHDPKTGLHWKQGDYYILFLNKSNLNVAHRIYINNAFDIFSPPDKDYFLFADASDKDSNDNVLGETGATQQRIQIYYDGKQKVYYLKRIHYKYNLKIAVETKEEKMSYWKPERETHEALDLKFNEITEYKIDNENSVIILDTGVDLVNKGNSVSDGSVYERPIYSMVTTFP